jgi:hypothetical protein
MKIRTLIDNFLLVKFNIILRKSDNQLRWLGSSIEVLDSTSESKTNKNANSVMKNSTILLVTITIVGSLITFYKEINRPYSINKEMLLEILVRNYPIGTYIFDSEEHFKYLTDDDIKNLSEMHNANFLNAVPTRDDSDQIFATNVHPCNFPFGGNGIGPANESDLTAIGLRNPDFGQSGFANYLLNIQNASINNANSKREPLDYSDYEADKLVHNVEHLRELLSTATQLHKDDPTFLEIQKKFEIKFGKKGDEMANPETLIENELKQVDSLNDSSENKIPKVSFESTKSINPSKKYILAPIKSVKEKSSHVRDYVSHHEKPTPQSTFHYAKSNQKELIKATGVRTREHFKSWFSNVDKKPTQEDSYKSLDSSPDQKDILLALAKTQGKDRDWKYSIDVNPIFGDELPFFMGDIEDRGSLRQQERMFESDIVEMKGVSGYLRDLLIESDQSDELVSIESAVAREYLTNEQRQVGVQSVFLNNEDSVSFWLKRQLTTIHEGDLFKQDEGRKVFHESNIKSNGKIKSLEEVISEDWIKRQEEVVNNDTLLLKSFYNVLSGKVEESKIDLADSDLFESTDPIVNDNEEEVKTNDVLVDAAVDNPDESVSQPTDRIDLNVRNINSLNFMDFLEESYIAPYDPTDRKAQNFVSEENADAFDIKDNNAVFRSIKERKQKDQEDDAELRRQIKVDQENRLKDIQKLNKKTRKILTESEIKKVEFYIRERKKQRAKVQKKYRKQIGPISQDEIHATRYNLWMQDKIAVHENEKKVVKALKTRIFDQLKELAFQDCRVTPKAFIDQTRDIQDYEYEWTYKGLKSGDRFTDKIYRIHQNNSLDFVVNKVKPSLNPQNDFNILTDIQFKWLPKTKLGRLPETKSNRVKNRKSIRSRSVKRKSIRLKRKSSRLVSRYNHIWNFDNVYSSLEKNSGTTLRFDINKKMRNMEREYFSPVNKEMDEKMENIRREYFSPVHKPSFYTNKNRFSKLVKKYSKNIIHNHYKQRLKNDFIQHRLLNCIEFESFDLVNDIHTFYGSEMQRTHLIKEEAFLGSYRKPVNDDNCTDFVQYKEFKDSSTSAELFEQIQDRILEHNFYFPEDNIEVPEEETYLQNEQKDIITENLNFASLLFDINPSFPLLPSEEDIVLIESRLDEVLGTEPYTFGKVSSQSPIDEGDILFTKIFSQSTSSSKNIDNPIKVSSDTNDLKHLSEPLVSYLNLKRENLLSQNKELEKDNTFNAPSVTRKEGEVPVGWESIYARLTQYSGGKEIFGTILAQSEIDNLHFLNKVTNYASLFDPGIEKRSPIYDYKDINYNYQSVEDAERDPDYSLENEAAFYDGDLNNILREDYPDKEDESILNEVITSFGWDNVAFNDIGDTCFIPISQSYSQDEFEEYYERAVNKEDEEAVIAFEAEQQGYGDTIALKPSDSIIFPELIVKVPPPILKGNVELEPLPIFWSFSPPIITKEIYKLPYQRKGFRGYKIESLTPDDVYYPDIDVNIRARQPAVTTIALLTLVFSANIYRGIVLLFNEKNPLEKYLPNVINRWISNRLIPILIIGSSYLLAIYVNRIEKGHSIRHKLQVYKWLGKKEIRQAAQDLDYLYLDDRFFELTPEFFGSPTTERFIQRKKDKIARDSLTSTKWHTFITDPFIIFARGVDNLFSGTQPNRYTVELSLPTVPIELYPLLKLSQGLVSISRQSLRIVVIFAGGALSLFTESIKFNEFGKVFNEEELELYDDITENEGGETTGVGRASYAGDVRDAYLMIYADENSSSHILPVLPVRNYGQHLSFYQGISLNLFKGIYRLQFEHYEKLHSLNLVYTIYPITAGLLSLFVTIPFFLNGWVVGSTTLFLHYVIKEYRLQIFDAFCGGDPYGMGSALPILVSGPQGSGRLTFLRLVAKELSISFIYDNVVSILGSRDQYAQYGRDKVMMMLTRAHQRFPCMVTFRGFELTRGARSSLKEDDTNLLRLYLEEKTKTKFVVLDPKRKQAAMLLILYLLVVMDHAIDIYGFNVYFTGTTAGDILDPALRRAGRFHKVWDFSLPTFSKLRQAVFFSFPHDIFPTACAYGFGALMVEKFDDVFQANALARRQFVLRLGLVATESMFYSQKDFEYSQSLIFEKTGSGVYSCWDQKSNWNQKVDFDTNRFMKFFYSASIFRVTEVAYRFAPRFSLKEFEKVNPIYQTFATSQRIISSQIYTSQFSEILGQMGSGFSVGESITAKERALESAFEIPFGAEEIEKYIGGIPFSTVNKIYNPSDTYEPRVYGPFREQIQLSRDKLCILLNFHMICQLSTSKFYTLLFFWFSSTEASVYSPIQPIICVDSEIAFENYINVKTDLLVEIK